MVDHRSYRDDENEPLMADEERIAVGVGAGPAHPDAPLHSIVAEAILQVDDTTSASASTSTSTSNDDTATPRFLRQEGYSKQWKTIPYPLRRTLIAVIKWSRGPPNPQPYRITPLFPAVQEYPLRLVERFLPSRRRRAAVVLLYFSLWLISFVLVKRQETLAAEVAGWGTSQAIGCGDSYWGAGNSCGVDGDDCRPFNGSGFAFSCSASCAGYHVLNPRAVGDQEISYRSLVIGGPSTSSSSSEEDEDTYYRGDSFVCGAAIHAGVISDDKGGCGVVELVGQHQGFVSSRRNGITSVGFDSYFPLSFRFVPGVKCTVKDQRWSLLAISAAFTGVLSLFTSSPALFFFPSFVGIFWTVGMALDQPGHSSVADLFSNVLGKFLPAMFCAWVMYDRMGVRRTLDRLTAQAEKTLLWLGACWVGALTNYTLDFIPIQRLDAHDIKQQPGAKAALAVIILLLVGIVASQAWFFRQEARFTRYIKLYALLLLAILVSLSLPGLNLRIHHYVLALLLLPGTSMQTRPCLLYQGLLIGLFINGIARWGFDAVLQTPAALQGDAQQGSALPILIPPVIELNDHSPFLSSSSSSSSSSWSSSITFEWAAPPSARFDGISILVNDVERYRSYFDDDAGQDSGKFVWSRRADLGVPEYFRFAFMSGSSSGDYTRAGTWLPDGSWKEMEPGPSK